MILRRYISEQVITTTIIVLGFLLFLLLGGRIIRYFGMAAEGQLDIGILFVIISYNIPFLLELILPLAFFIALMLVLGRLYVDHEMAVINSSGFSRMGVTALSGFLIIILFVCEAWLSIVGKPWGLKNTETIWQEQSVKTAFDLIQAGQFISSGDYHLYVGSVDEKLQQLQDIILIQTDDKEKKDNEELPKDLDYQALKQQKLSQLNSKDSLILAKYAKQVSNDSSESIQLDLFNGRRYKIGANSQKYNQVSFQRYRLSLIQMEEKEIDEGNVAIQSIDKIWQSSLEGNFIAQAELGYRLSLPWLIVFAGLFATSLATVAPRKGRWLRLVPSILLFVIIALSIISLKKPIAEQRISVWAYLWLIIAWLILGLYLNWASHIYQRIRFMIMNKNLPQGNG